MKQTDAFILGIIFGAIIFYNILKKIRSRRISSRVTKAKRAEGKAIKLLKKNGYEVIETQKRALLTMTVDENPSENWVQADLIVKKGRKKYVAEVKTGEIAQRITSSAIRRQLLEYYLVYRPKGILLVDMERERIREVRFTYAKGWRQSIWIYLAMGFICGMISVYLWIKGGQV